MIKNVRILSTNETVLTKLMYLLHALFVISVDKNNARPKFNVFLYVIIFTRYKYIAVLIDISIIYFHIWLQNSTNVMKKN